MKTCQLAFKQRTGTTVISSATIPVNMNKLSVNVGESQITQSLKVRDLGVTFDQILSFDNHITAICRSTYFHIRKTWNLLLYNAYSTIIHAPLPNSEQTNLPSSNHTYTKLTPKHIHHHCVPLCNINTHDTHNLFNCTHIRTTLSPLDLWTDPAGVTALLARWTEKLAGGPQTGISDSPPLARVMGVGRQQQSCGI